MLEFIMEFVFDLAFDGVVEASKSNRLPKIVRYILIGIIVAIYVLIVCAFAWIAISSFKEGNYAGGYATAILDIAILVICVLAFRKTYLKRK